MGYKDDIVDQYPYLTYANEPGATIEDAGGGGGGGDDNTVDVAIYHIDETADVKIPMYVGIIDGDGSSVEFDFSLESELPVFNKVAYGSCVTVDDDRAYAIEGCDIRSKSDDRVIADVSPIEILATGSFIYCIPNVENSYIRIVVRDQQS